MTKFEEFVKLAKDSEDTRLIDLVEISKEYIEGLDRIFDDREITSTILREIDLPMFIDNMKQKGIFDKYQNHQGKLFLMDVLYIARHTWEHTDKRGNIKNGNDLHKVWPLMFEEDVQVSPADVVRALE